MYDNIKSIAFTSRLGYSALSSYTPKSHFLTVRENLAWSYNFEN